MFEVFKSIYEQKIWGNNQNEYYSGSSGGGSDVDYNRTTYIPFLKEVFKTLKISSVVDLGCGDFLCGPLIYTDTDITYYGFDIYDKVIQHHQLEYKDQANWTFECLDFYNNIDKLPNGDMCILKDVIQHWKNEYIYAFLDKLLETKKFKYVLIVNCCNQIMDHQDIDENGDGRPLSYSKYPLKKYDPKPLYKYNTKEASLITIC